jgi:biopolymer transport protein ExbB
VSWLFKAWELVQAGGPVMWPLMALSLWLWSLVLVKLLWLWQAGREGLSLPDAVDHLQSGMLPLPRGPRGRALAVFMALRSGSLKSDLLWWEVAVRRQGPRLWRHVNTVLVLATVAPLLGLLGTVTGMIDTFQVIRFFGTSNAQALSAGISQALITTQTGLLVAIPGLFAGYFLRRQARNLQQSLASFQQDLDRWIKTSEAKQCCV